MQRRDFITLLSGAAATWPLAARAQQSERMRRIGVLHRTADDPKGPASQRSRRGCSNWAGPMAATCGSTYRWGAGDVDAFANTRRNWSRLRRTSSSPWHRPDSVTLLQATRTVPIVFTVVTDPVGAGFVDNLARPGGNVTGFMLFEYSLSGEMAGTAQTDRAGRDARGGPSRSRHSRRHRPVCRDPVRGAVARGRGESDQRA